MDCDFQFEVIARDGTTNARTGRIATPHGEVDTPAFMPVGTQGAVKTLAQEDLEALGAQIVLCNAYHLFLRPGPDRLVELGGLHRFMTWDRPILTDSGGFQVFSLGALNKVTPEGVTFQSHLDGTRHVMTPERATDVQIAIGADIIMCFDECTSYPVDAKTAAKSMRMTADWAARCKVRWQEREARQQALFGIVQGSVYRALREESAARTVEIGFPGYAIGGVSVGESKAEMVEVVDCTAPLLPDRAPRYLMGVGPPEDILEAVERGVDLFDCVMPTRVARNGALYTRDGRFNIKNRQYANDMGPIEEGCRCPVCQRYTRAYLNHLYRSGEVTALRLNTLHNLWFMLDFFANARQAIRAGQFQAFKQAFLSKFRA